MLFKTSILVSALSGLAVAAWMPFTFAPQSPKLALASQAEIKTLISDLGSIDYKTREKVSKRLVEIGLPALPALEVAEESSDLETRQRAAALVNRIRAANRLPTRVNGMEFKLVLDEKTKVNKFPQVTVKGALHIKNTKDTLYRLNIDRTVRGFLQDAQGKFIVPKNSNLGDLHPSFLDKAGKFLLARPASSPPL